MKITPARTIMAIIAPLELIFNLKTWKYVK